MGSERLARTEARQYLSHLDSNGIILKRSFHQSPSKSMRTAGPYKMALQLVNLPEVEKISPVIIRILGGNPGKVEIASINVTFLVLRG